MGLGAALLLKHCNYYLFRARGRVTVRSGRSWLGEKQLGVSALS